MSSTIDSTFFGRSQAKSLSLTSLKAKFRKCVPQIINFCNNHAKKCRSRHQNQNILFPGNYQQEPIQQISKELKESYRKQAQYPFYLSQPNMFIDNYYLKIMKKQQGIPIQVSCLGYGNLIWFAEWVGVPKDDYIVGVTDLNWVILVSIKFKNFFRYRIQNPEDDSNKHIISVNCHQNCIYIFSSNEYHILNYQNSKEEKLQLVLSRKICSHINKGYGIYFDKSYFVFGIDQKSAVIWKPSEGILRMDFISIPFHDSQDGSLISNFAIHLKGNIITAAFGSHSLVIVKTYNLNNSAIKLVSQKQNIYCRSVNIKKEYVPYLNFIERQQYILLAIGFRYKLFFIKISNDSVQISKRVKFPHKIELVSSFGQNPGIVVVLENNLERVLKKVIIVTHENKIASFSSYVNLTAIQKSSLQVELQNPINNTSDVHRPIMIYQNNEVFLMQKCSILRAALNKWQDIYNQMKITQNIKLLQFLIMLKMVPSPFLKQPTSFEGLQNFFDIYDEQTQQILLEYYYIMNMNPTRINISQNPQLMIPFIIEHKIDNLSKENQQNLMNWCLKYDERLVEEMIIGGAECGWEYAVKNGWVRAFKVMVESGMEIQMPILKLYSMALYQKTVEVNKILNQKKQVLTSQGQKYLFQMIQYIKFVLSQYFKDMIGDGKNIEFRQVFFIIFKPETWTFMTNFAPQKAIQILTYCFMHLNSMKEISYYQSRDLKIFRQTFKQLILNYPPTNIQLIVSHLSQNFRRTNSEHYQLLMQEHAKFMLFKFKRCLQKTVSAAYNHTNTLRIYQLLNLENIQRQTLFEEIRKYKERHFRIQYFNFKKDYLKDMLLLLIRYDNKILKELFDFYDNFVYNGSSKFISNEQKQCERNFFLAYIWIQIYVAIVEEIFSQKKKEPDVQIKKKIKKEVKLILSEIEERNYESYYLIIHLKMSINSGDEFTANIFRTYMQCRSSIIKSKIFFWIRKNIPHSTVLQEQFIKNLKQLIFIDKQESKVILETFFEGRQKEIIKKLDHDSALQLQYVELVIQGGDESLESYYTNLHVELILKLTPWQLINIIKKKKSSVQYDISQALKMVEASKDFPQKNDILIFLYETEGEITKCIQTFLNCFELSLMKYIEISQKSRQDETPNQNSLLKTSMDSKDWSFSSNCMRELNSEISQLQKKFFELIQLIYRQLQVKYKYIKLCLQKFSALLGYILTTNHKFKTDYLNLITVFFGNFMVQIFEHNYLHYLSKWIQQYEGKTQYLTQLQSYMIDVYDKIYIHLSTLKSTTIMDRKVLVNQIGQTLRKLEFSISSNAFCRVCQQDFKNQDVILEALLFSCGHLYHKSCIQPVNGQDYCYYCVYANQYKSMMEHPQLNLVDLLRKFKQSKQIMMKPGAKIDIIQKQTLISTSQKRKNRMKLFDKKMTSIETQAQIIDLKMVLEQYFKSQSKT